MCNKAAVNEQIKIKYALLFEKRVFMGYNILVGRAPVAQLDRASDSDSEGQRFESARVYQIKAVLKPEKNKKGKYLSYFFSVG